MYPHFRKHLSNPHRQKHTKRHPERHTGTHTDTDTQQPNRQTNRNSQTQVDTHTHTGSRRARIRDVNCLVKTHKTRGENKPRAQRVLHGYTTVYSRVLSRQSDYQSHTHDDNGLCAVCVRVCVTMSFAERNF